MKNVYEELVLGLSLGLILALTACNSPSKSTSTASGTTAPTKTASTATNNDLAFTNYVYIAANANISEYGIDPDDHTLVNLDTQSYGLQGKALINSNIDGAAYNSLVIHPSGKWMYSAMYNYNTTGMFKINANGTLSKIGTGIGPAGIQPLGITFNAAGNLIYVKNNGGDASGNNIISMTINPSTGALGTPVLVATVANMASFIATNSLVFQGSNTSATLGEWTYAFIVGSMPIGIFQNGSLVTYAHDAFIGSAIVLK